MHLVDRRQNHDLALGAIGLFFNWIAKQYLEFEVGRYVRLLKYGRWGRMGTRQEEGDMCGPLNNEDN